MRGVGAFAYRTQTVERGDAEGRGEVAVRAAAGRAIPPTRFPTRAPVCAPCRNSRFTAAVRSSGGRFKPPLTSMVQRRSNGFSARNFCSSTAASRKRATRISTSARASAATTLERVPPAITPGLTVMPRSKFVNPAMHSICRASSSTALAPAWKSTPGVRGLAAHRHGESAHALCARFSACPPVRCRVPAPAPRGSRARFLR